MFYSLACNNKNTVGYLILHNASNLYLIIETFNLTVHLNLLGFIKFVLFPDESDSPITLQQRFEYEMRLYDQSYIHWKKRIKTYITEERTLYL